MGDHVWFHADFTGDRDCRGGGTDMVASRRGDRIFLPVDAKSYCFVVRFQMCRTKVVVAILPDEFDGAIRSQGQLPGCFIVAGKDSESAFWQ